MIVLEFPFIFIQILSVKEKCHVFCSFSFLPRNLEAPEIPVYSVKGHKEIINSIDGVGGLGIGKGAPEIVTGSRDGELVNSASLSSSSEPASS